MSLLISLVHLFFIYPFFGFSFHPSFPPCLVVASNIIFLKLKHLFQFNWAVCFSFLKKFFVRGLVFVFILFSSQKKKFHALNKIQRHTLSLLMQKKRERVLVT